MAGNYDQANLERISVKAEDTEKYYKNAITGSENLYSDIDPRIKQEYPEFTKINMLHNEMHKYVDSGSQAAEYYRSAHEAEKATEEKVADLVAQLPGGGSGGSGGSGGGSGGSGGGEDYKFASTSIGTSDYAIDSEKWANLPASEKEKITSKLREVGFTDDEIQQIINGQKPVSRYMVDKMSIELEELLKNNASLRQRIKDLYGFDIFNPDGTINKDKLAIALLIDGKNPNDKYDLQKIINELKYGQKIQVGAVSGPNITNSAPIMEQTKIEDSKVEDKEIEKIVSGGAIAGGTMGAADAAEAVAETLATEQEKNIAGVLGDLTGSVGSIGKAVAPTGGNIETNNSSAGIIAGAGLAAAGAIGGGGAYAHHNLLKLTFTADDFYSLSGEDQNAILNDMTKSGYTEEEIIRFKESDFCVDDSFITDISKAIKKSAEMSEEVKKQIRDKYGYDLLDALNKTNKYKIFATALIDGKNASDDFNLYNILNPILSETNLTNLTYFGLLLEEVLLTEEVAKKIGIFDKLGRTYKFTQADYESQDDYTKSAIVSTLTAAGLNSDEIEKMRTATFKVKVSIMNPVIDKLEKINEEQSNFAQKITDLYKFSLIDVEGKVDKYRLFVAMIIDGYSLNDDYNIYKLIVEATGDEKTNNPEYAGLKIEDVIVEKSEKEEQQEDANNLGQLNMTETGLEEDPIMINQDVNSNNPPSANDFLKELGID